MIFLIFSRIKMNSAEGAAGRDAVSQLKEALLADRRESWQKGRASTWADDEVAKGGKGDSEQRRRHYERARQCIHEEARRLSALNAAQERGLCDAQKDLHQATARASGFHADLGDALTTAAEALTAILAAPLLSLGLLQSYIEKRERLLQTLSAYIDEPGLVDPPLVEEAQRQRQARQEVELRRLESALQLDAEQRVRSRVIAAMGEEAFYQEFADRDKEPAASLASVVALEARVHEKTEHAVELAKRAAALEPLRMALTRVESAIGAAEARCEARRQAVAVLTRQAARQALLSEVISKEAEALQAAAAVGAAAVADAKDALSVTAMQQQQEGPAPARRSDDGAAKVASLSAAFVTARGNVLRACTALEREFTELQGETLHSLKASFSRLAAAGLDLSDPGKLAAPPCNLRAQMKATTATAEVLRRDAAATLDEVSSMQKRPEPREVAERVLVQCFGPGGDPVRLLGV
jgi:hypothetical protein